MMLHQTGELTDLAAGEYASDYIYDDSKPSEIDARLPFDAPHRAIDLYIKQFADNQKGENVRIQIILPPTVYGLGIG
jgi:hypothetical protein